MQQMANDEMKIRLNPKLIPPHFAIPSFFFFTCYTDSHWEEYTRGQENMRGTKTTANAFPECLAQEIVSGFY